MHSAIKMLISRVALLHQLLLKMQSGGCWAAAEPCFGSHWADERRSSAVSRRGCFQVASVCVLLFVFSRLPHVHAGHRAGEVPFDHDLVRQAAGLIRRLPAVDSQQFGQDYTTVGVWGQGRLGGRAEGGATGEGRGGGAVVAACFCCVGLRPGVPCVRAVLTRN